MEEKGVLLSSGGVRAVRSASVPGYLLPFGREGGVARLCSTRDGKRKTPGSVCPQRNTTQRTKQHLMIMSPGAQTDSAAACLARAEMLAADEC